MGKEREREKGGGRQEKEREKGGREGGTQEKERGGGEIMRGQDWGRGYNGAK